MRKSLNIQTYQVKEESERCPTGNNSQSKSAVGLLNQARIKRDQSQVNSCEDLKTHLEPTVVARQGKLVKSTNKLIEAAQ